MGFVIMRMLESLRLRGNEGMCGCTGEGKCIVVKEGVCV